MKVVKKSNSIEHVRTLCHFSVYYELYFQKKSQPERFNPERYFPAKVFLCEGRKLATLAVVIMPPLRMPSLGGCYSSGGC